MLCRTACGAWYTNEEIEEGITMVVQEKPDLEAPFDALLATLLLGRLLAKKAAAPRPENAEQEVVA